jgi:hypothetical protein
MMVGNDLNIFCICIPERPLSIWIRSNWIKLWITKMKVYKALPLGNLLDYHLELPFANKSMIKIWIEGYKKGKKLDSPLISITYGQSPHQVEEGHMGLGYIRTQEDKDFIFIYEPSGGIIPKEIDGNIITSEGMSTWTSALRKTSLKLKSGEIGILGAFRQVKDSMRTYDLQDEESVKKMISEDDTVLLFKIKVEKEME